MVSISDDLGTLLADVTQARNADGIATREKLDTWITCLTYIHSLTVGPSCEECGAPMVFDATLQAHVCHHPED